MFSSQPGANERTNERIHGCCTFVAALFLTVRIQAEQNASFTRNPKRETDCHAGFEAFSRLQNLVARRLAEFKTISRRSFSSVLKAFLSHQQLKQDGLFYRISRILSISPHCQQAWLFADCGCNLISNTTRLPQSFCRSERAQKI